MPIIFKGAIMFKDKCGVVNEKMSAVFHFQWKPPFTNGHLILNALTGHSCHTFYSSDSSSVRLEAMLF